MSTLPPYETQSNRSVDTPVSFDTVVVPGLVEKEFPATHRQDPILLDAEREHFEIVFVDDGSTDQTAARLRRLSAEEPRVRVLRLARNYGQEAAVQAGMLRAQGRWIVQTDGDLQHPPEEIPKLLRMHFKN